VLAPHLPFIERTAFGRRIVVSTECRFPEFAYRPVV
jgi:hypothetical protein